MAATSQNLEAPIDLSKILYNKDAEEVNRMQKAFESNGWCFVLLPAILIPSPELIKTLSDFFDSSWKTKFSQKPIYGYSKVNHKEGIKLLTGPYFNELANKGLVPYQLVEPLNVLSQHFDATTKRLIEVLDQYCVFQDQPSLSMLSEKANLPMQHKHFGMLDIVSYFNEKSGFEAPTNGQNTNEVNCVPHYDPGLLSISILSTHEGLELKDMSTNRWISGPLDANVGVIWLGEAAARLTKNRLKPGIHRVVYPQRSKIRLTLWYEVCTVEQLKAISNEKDDEIMDEGEVTFDGLLGLPPIKVLPGERKLAFLRRIEEAHGLSMSKMGPPHYRLAQYPISFESKTRK